MKKYIIVTDSTCDLNVDLTNAYDIKVIGMNVILDEESYLHNIDYKNMSNEEFYTRLRNGSMAKTSQINPNDYVEFLGPYLNEYDILYVSLSSGLSSTFQSFNIAKAMLKETNPETKILGFDTLGASGGVGLFAILAANNLKQGKSIEENLNWLNDNQLNLAHWFTVDDLHFLKRGGRVSATTAIVGSALKIKPVLHVDDNGKLINVSKAHGRANSIKALAIKLEETIVNPEEQTIVISNADCFNEAVKLADEIKARVNVKEIIHTSIGPVIGCHSGPGTIALFFLATTR